MDIIEIQEKLLKIKEMGYVKSFNHRKGDTGSVGRTLEYLMGLKENNVNLPDLGKIELKSQRQDDSSMLTLFTYDRNAWVVKQLEAIEKYGKYDDDGKKGMNYTVSVKPNKAGFFIDIDDDFVIIKHKDGTAITQWNLENLVKKFQTKVKKVLLVSAKVKTINGIEHYCYDKANLLNSRTNKNLLIDRFKNGEILIDLRLHRKEVAGKKPASRNHGTAFRVKRNKIDLIYENIKEIL